MKTNKKIKNLICYIVAFTLAIVANIGLLTSLQKPKETVFAASNNNYLPIKVDNASFTNKDSNNQPKNYTASISNTSVDAKVIDVTDTEIASRFSNLARTSHDNYVLMLDSGNKISNFGYTTNESITLTKGGNYLISVDVFTAESGTGYIELTSNDEVYSSISNIVSNNDWTTYYFFVKNNEVEDVNVKIGLFLRNSSGVVMFDNVCAKQINDNELANYTNNQDLSSYRYKLINNTNNTVLKAEDYSFTHTQTETGKSYTTTETVLNTDGEYKYAYKITNSQKTYATLETLSLSDSVNNLEFNQNSIYKVKINVKAEELSGTAKIKLIQIVEDEENAVNGEISINANTATNDNITNDYKTYSFYIKTGPKGIANYKLQVEFGTVDNKASGSIYLSAIEISNITTSIYDATDSNGTKIDLTSKITDDSTLLTNGKFNFVTINNQNSNYPATAKDWTVTTGTNKQAYGIINTSNEEFAKISGYENLSNPLSTRNDNTAIDNNILMLHNTEADTLSYTSSAKTSLAAKSIHKFQAMVNTHNSPATISLVTTNDGKEIVLSSIVVYTNYEWEKVEMYVKVGYQPTDISVKITLDSTSWASVFVDDVRCDYYSQPTEDDFNKAPTSNFEIKTDLTNLLTANSLNLFKTEENNNVDVNIIKVSSNPVQNEEFTRTDAEYALAINAYKNETYHKITSNLGFKLTSGTNYKISVDVYTQFLEMSSENANTDLLGAQIKLSSFDETFTSIVSNNQWTTYTFYINPNNTTTAYLELYLGNENALQTGDVFFSNIQFVESVSDTEFNSAVEKETTKILKNTVVEDEETEDNTTTESKPKNEINWFYFASSIIFALALIICVVGVMVKKIKWKKPTKKSKNVYDRNKTVSKQYYMRKATTMREDKVRELEKDLETLHTERAKYEDVYKHDLSKLRELKIKRASADEIKKLEKELKKNQKLSAGIGVTINKVQADLDYAKTDAYLNSLIRKLSTSNNNQSENKE